MKLKLKIEIIGNKVSILLLDKKRNIISKSIWIDNRDLSEKVLKKISLLLRKNKLTIKDIEKVDFKCDSPYFEKNKKIDFEDTISSKNKCGFMAWQTGEITAKTLNSFLPAKFDYQHTQSASRTPLLRGESHNHV